MKIRVILMAFLLSILINVNVLFAQQIEMLPILEWKYQPDGIIGQFAMSSNNQYFVVQVNVESGPYEEKQGIHLLDKDGELKWEKTIDTDKMGYIEELSITDTGYILVHTKIGFVYGLTHHIYLFNNYGKLEWLEKFEFDDGVGLNGASISPDGNFIGINISKATGKTTRGGAREWLSSILLIKRNREKIFEKISDNETSSYASE